MRSDLRADGPPGSAAELPAGAARREGTGSQGPRRGSCARRTGRERDLTGRGQRGAPGRSGERRAESAAPEPSGEERTEAPMERYKGKGSGPRATRLHFLLGPHGTGKQS